MINVFSRKNIFFKNFIFLALGQGLNQLIPLLITPVLLSEIGSASFSQYAIYQYIVLYISIFVNFGFLLSATKNVAIISLEEETSVLFSSIFYSKLLNFIGIIGVFLVGIYFYPPTSHYYFSYAMGIIITGVGYVFYQDWFFQGKQKIFYQFMCIIISKVIYLFFLFIGIKWFGIGLSYLTFIDSFSILLMGLISHFITHYRLNLKLIPFIRINVINVWNEGIKAFMGIILISLFTNINAILLGFFSSPEEVSIYSIADRIFIILSGIFAIISRVAYPDLAKTIHESEQLFQTSFNKNLKFITLGVIIISVIVFCFSKLILGFLLSNTIPVELVFPVLNILLVALIFQTVAAIYSYKFILKLEYKRMNTFLMIVVIANLAFAIIIIPKFGAIGAALSTTFSFIFCYLLFSLGGKIYKYTFKQIWNL